MPELNFEYWLNGYVFNSNQTNVREFIYEKILSHKLRKLVMKKHGCCRNVVYQALEVAQYFSIVFFMQREINDSPTHNMFPYHCCYRSNSLNLYLGKSESKN